MESAIDIIVGLQKPIWHRYAYMRASPRHYLYRRSETL